MTTYRTTTIPAEDLNKIVVICNGCKSRLTLDLKQREREVKLLRCPVCDTEFSEEADEAINRFIRFRTLVGRKGVYVEFILEEKEPERT